ncbi:MAG: VWA domain-containing protein [Acidobacteria bacterium]|nr:VWA domain-containing protein [Acidobacteriota bacterium]
MLKPILSCALSLAVAVGPLLNVTTPSSSQAGDPPLLTIQKTRREVQLEFHIFLDGRAIRNVQRNQIVVYQDGKQVTEITGFYEEQDLPLQLVLMIDTSASMTKEFAPEQAAAMGFLRRMTRLVTDQSMVVAFSTHATLNPSLDGSAPASFRQIALLRPAGLTALFDSICEVSARISESSPQSGRSRNVLILLSDGADTYSLNSLEQAIAAALDSNLTIYAITDHAQHKVSRGDINLQKLAAATGGQVFFLKKFKSTEGTFVELEREIHSQYTVTFALPGDSCGFHSVRVETTDPKMQVRSRGGFYRDCSEHH